METSILTSTKKVLGLVDEYTIFDLDITTYINSTFSILNQLGIGPDEGFAIEDASALWADFGLPLNQMNLVKTYVYLRVKMLFDPPTTSYILDATKTQLEEYEGRLSYFREDAIPRPLVVVEVNENDPFEEDREEAEEVILG